MKFIIFALIPLILSIGIIPAIPFSDAAEITCSSGKVLMVDVTGRPNCTWEESVAKLEKFGWETVIKKDTTIPKAPLEEVEEKTGEAPALETVKTRIGTLTLQTDYHTPESDKILKDELFFQRAVQVYLLGLPAVNMAGLFDRLDEVGASTGDIVYFSDFQTSDVPSLTQNTSTLYLFNLLDLTEGPLVLDLPPNLYGTSYDLAYQPLTDFGPIGPDKGQGGKYLFITPNYNGEIPEGYFVIPTEFMQNTIFLRSFVHGGDKAAAVALFKDVKIYNLSESTNPPEQKFIDLSGKKVKMTHPDTDGYWELLHKIYSKEPVVRPEDKILYGLMYTVGIIPGQPFEPDEHSKKLLDEAAIVANQMARNISYDTPGKQEYILYEEFSNWEITLQANNPFYDYDNGVPMMDRGIGLLYFAFSMGHSYFLEDIGKGSKYIHTFRDANDEWLDGGNLYHLHLPPNVPIENFWSAVVYDAGTRALIDNDLQPQPSIRSLDSDKLIQNEDGSYELYFGPEAPEGYENNWIKTNEGEGFFVVFRFYSPTEAYYDKSWQLPNVEKLE